MKYINGKELLMFLTPPITKLSVFEAETVDATLVMCADAFPKLEEQFQVTIDFPTFKFQLLRTMQDFIERCQTCPYECLKQPRQHIEEKRYQALSVDLKQWPKHLQKNNAENFFLIEYTLTMADIIYRYVIDSGLPKEFTHRFANEVAMKLAQWIDDNCIKKCEYECIRRSTSNGYCTLCSYMIQPLACPMKKEISFERLAFPEEELKCMRKN